MIRRHIADLAGKGVVQIYTDWIERLTLLFTEIQSNWNLTSEDKSERRRYRDIAMNGCFSAIVSACEYLSFDHPFCLDDDDHRMLLQRPFCGLRLRSRMIGQIELRCSFTKRHSGCRYRVQIFIRDRIVLSYRHLWKRCIRGVCIQVAWELLQEGIGYRVDVVISGGHYDPLDKVLRYGIFLTSNGDHEGPDRFRRRDPRRCPFRWVCISVRRTQWVWRLIRNVSM